MNQSVKKLADSKKADPEKLAELLKRKDQEQKVALEAAIERIRKAIQV